MRHISTGPVFGEQTTAVLPPGVSHAGILNGVPYQAVFDDDGIRLEALGDAAFYYKNGDPVRILDLAPGSGTGGGGGDLQKLLEAARAEALRRLTNNKCFKFFGGQGLGTVLKTDYRFYDLGAPKVGADGKVSVVGAATLSPTFVAINEKGPFVNQEVNVPGKGPVVLDFGTGFRGAKFGALLLLHELGHQLSGITGFKPDAANSGLNRSQTQKILNNCF